MQNADYLVSHAHNYANMTALVIRLLFSAFKDGYLVFLSDINFKFRMQTMFRINSLPFSIAFTRRY